ncbi:TPA: helix-turn-helix transcriptional regulator [Burkholderia vietnamiensis]|uniref:helix-turn-helix domain-containing protein n=1 Tax=Burkholderia vietnamiensis TaxID=60552 RepID=UPI00158D0982|nr:helix-turn-helix transcriptional regulator [Burkholderia vietnamiensis]HDR9003006.1 helix-turn-helix transcriptional regulator [Burkholderia vietnamiensis]HDR9006950.1 helix-turn-helix transcriptional regulator [Burkholderia vietnamiensis]
MSAGKPNICEALRLIRVYHDIKQKEMSVRVGVGVPAISMLESGQRQPSIEVLHKYAGAFGVPMSSILFLAEQLASPPIQRPVSKTIHKTVIQILNWIADKHEQGTQP